MFDDTAIVHLNIAVDRYTPEELSDKVLDFHFLNLEDESKDNYFPGYKDNTNEGNPDANIDALLFGNDEEATE